MEQLKVKQQVPEKLLSYIPIPFLVLSLSYAGVRLKLHYPLN